VLCSELTFKRPPVAIHQDKGLFKYPEKVVSIVDRAARKPQSLLTCTLSRH